MELEARALVVKSLERICHSRFGHDNHQLLLTDSLSMALAFDPARSRSYRVLQQIRRFAALALSRNVSPQCSLGAVRVKLGRWAQPNDSSWQVKKIDRFDPNSACPSAAGSWKLLKTSSKQLRSTRRPQLCCQARWNQSPAGNQWAGFCLRPTCQRGWTARLWSKSGQPLDQSHLPFPVASKRKRSNSSDSSSSSSDPPAVKKMQANLIRRRRRRLALYVTEILEAKSQGLALLEKKAVQAKTEAYYTKEYTEFMSFVKESRLTVGSAASMDSALCQYMTSQFLAGHPSHKGDKLVAAVCHSHAQFSKARATVPPPHNSCHERVRGVWPPGQSRKAWPLAVWSAVWLWKWCACIRCAWRCSLWQLLPATHAPQNY